MCTITRPASPPAWRSSTACSRSQPITVSFMSPVSAGMAETIQSGSRVRDSSRISAMRCSSPARWLWRSSMNAPKTAAASSTTTSTTRMPTAAILPDPPRPSGRRGAIRCTSS